MCCDFDWLIYLGHSDWGKKKEAGSLGNEDEEIRRSCYRLAAAGLGVSLKRLEWRNQGNTGSTPRGCIPRSCCDSLRTLEPFVVTLWGFYIDNHFVYGWKLFLFLSVCIISTPFLHWTVLSGTYGMIWKKTGQASLPSPDIWKKLFSSHLKWWQQL